jgi:hypothetical protein
MRSLGLVLCSVAILAGCSRESGPRLVPAKGTVRFAGGETPKGEVMVIRFEPTGGSEPSSGPQVAGKPSSAFQTRKAASGTIQPDGTFVLSTNEPNDGAYEGKFKVTFSMFKTYRGRERLIPAKYEKPDTTPFDATVTPGEANDFTFELERK